jgi:hypothetical protein
MANIIICTTLNLKGQIMILIIYAALWKQCTETKDCSVTQGLLCTRTSMQSNKTYVSLH